MVRPAGLAASILRPEELLPPDPDRDPAMTQAPDARPRDAAPSADAACLFCGIVEGRIPADVVHETDRTVAFRDINPMAPVHVLVVPRQHVENAAALGPEHAEDLAAMLIAAREVADAEGIGLPDRGYRLIFNVGPDALNSVPHLHLHVIGGRVLNWAPG